MTSDSNFFIKKMLGEDFFESLYKTEIWKPGTRSVSDTSDIEIGLKVVPKVLMKLLIGELTSMKIGETKEVQIPVQKQAMLRVTKTERDSFNGEIFEENKKITEFIGRSIPGIGLVLLSTFELYDIEQLTQETKTDPSIEHKVQQIIDERFAIHDLISKVVDKKLMEKDAIQQLVLAKLTESISAPKKVDPIVENTMPKKSLPLKEFLDARKSKNEFKIQMEKSETISCPDCHKEIFSSSGFSGCVCFGENYDSKVRIKKTESGVKISFPKHWTPDNIEMLLEVLRNKNGQ